MNWNTRSKLYDLVFSLPLIKGGREEEISNFAELFERARKNSSAEQKTTLDIGCGTGEFLKFHSSFNPSKTVGLDLSKDMLEKARKKSESRFFVLGSASALPFKDGSFDFISSIGVSEYFEDVNIFLREVSRVAGESSNLIVSYTSKSLFNIFRNLWWIRFFERSWIEIKEAVEEGEFEILDKRSMRIQAQILLKKIK